MSENKQGGARPGAGRKRRGTRITIRVSDNVLQYLQQIQRVHSLPDRSAAGAFALEKDADTKRYLDPSMAQ